MPKDDMPEKKSRKVLDFLQIAISKEVWKYVENLSSPIQLWEKLEILSVEYKGSTMLPMEYWIYDMVHDDFLGEDNDFKEDESDNTTDADVEVQEANVPKISEEDLNPNLVQGSLSCSHLLDSSDLDSINSYCMVNENCSFCEIDHICVNYQKFDKEDESLSYFDCKMSC